jgi:ferredoxin
MTRYFVWGKLQKGEQALDIISLKLIYFSPTRTTKKVLESIAAGIQVQTIEHIDLTPYETRKRRFKELQNELTIIGTPVYGGRVPADAARRLRRLKGNNTPAVIVVVYGNRHYDDALLELNDLVIAIGFKPVAAGVFVAEHTFSRENMPIAGGRPDAEDIEKARKFGKEIREKLKKNRVIGDIPPLKVPGNFPYIKLPDAKEILQIYPSTEETLCKKCETCITVCPAAAITITDKVITDKDACILCCACVKNCPTHARTMDSPRLQKIVESMSKRLSERKEPETFV